MFQKVLLEVMLPLEILIAYFTSILMRKLMPFKFRLDAKVFPAEFTAIFRFVCVSQEMNLQTDSLTKRLLAELANKPLVLDVRPQMLPVRRRVRETLVTDVATVRSFLCVHPQMLMVIEFVTKCFITKVTFIWFLSGMHDIMSYKVTLFLKFSMAYIAYIEFGFLVIHLFVFLEIVVCPKRFVANNTLVEFFFRENIFVLYKIRSAVAMSFVMSFEVTTPMKSFSTYLTHIIFFSSVC